MMKNKMLALLLSSAMAFSLCSCNDSSKSMGSFDPISSAMPSAVEPQDNGWLDEILPPTEAKPGTYQTISSDGESYFVVKNDHSLWAWGYNQNGQLGIGTNTTLSGPQQTSPIFVMEDVGAVSTWSDGSGSHTLIVKTDGTLWACGSNGCGQLGIGVAGDGIHPTPEYVMDDVVSVYARAGNSFAIKSDHSLWAWGGNGLGELGTGSTEPQLTPVKVLDDVASVAPDGFCTLAVKTDGTLWAWGSSHGGIILEDRTIPMQIMSDVTAACVGSGICGVIKTDGTLWVWGTFVDADYTSPVYVMDDAAAMSPNGSDGLYILKTAGTLWRWSTYSKIYYYTNAKELKLWSGNNEPENQVSDLVAIDGGLYGISMAVKSDGTLWDFGRDYRIIDNILIGGISKSSTIITPFTPHVSDWSTAYQAFVLNEEFLSADYPYEFEAMTAWGDEWEHRVSLHDFDQDGIPELAIGNGYSGKITDQCYVYTYENGNIEYIGTARLPFSCIPGSKYSGAFCEWGFDYETHGVTYYRKDGNRLVRESVYTYSLENVLNKNIETQDGALFVESQQQMTTVSCQSVSDVRQMGWDKFVGQALN